MGFQVLKGIQAIAQSIQRQGTLHTINRFFPQLAQNSSGVHWCRRGVRFNEVPKRFRVRFDRVPEKVPEKVPGSLGATPSQV